MPLPLPAVPDVRSPGIFRLRPGTESRKTHTVCSKVPHNALCRYRPDHIILEDLLNLFLMILICGTDEFIIGSVHEVPDLLDLSCDTINKLLRSHACVCSL
mgnify:CR=1 FL=1